MTRRLVIRQRGASRLPAEIDVERAWAMTATAADADAAETSKRETLTACVRCTRPAPVTDLLREFVDVATQ